MIKNIFWRVSHLKKKSKERHYRLHIPLQHYLSHLHNLFHDTQYDMYYYYLLVDMRPACMSLASIMSLTTSRASAMNECRVEEDGGPWVQQDDRRRRRTSNKLPSFSESLAMFPVRKTAVNATKGTSTAAIPMVATKQWTSYRGGSTLFGGHTTSKYSEIFLKTKIYTDVFYNVMTWFCIQSGSIQTCGLAIIYFMVANLFF